MLLAKDLMAFERDTTQHWMQHAHASAEGLLRQPLLVEDPHTHRSLALPLQACIWLHHGSIGCSSWIAVATFYLVVSLLWQCT